MKKISFVLVAAGLVSLAACTKPADTTNTANAMDANTTAMDNGAMEAGNASDTTTNASNAMDSAAGNATGEMNATGNVAGDAAGNTAGNASNAM